MCLLILGLDNAEIHDELKPIAKKAEVLKGVNRFQSVDFSPFGFTKLMFST